MTERDTVVVRDGSSGATAIVAVIAIVAILAIGWWLLFGQGSGSGGSDTEQPVPSLDVPAPSA